MRTGFTHFPYVAFRNRYLGRLGTLLLSAKISSHLKIEKSRKAFSSLLLGLMLSTFRLGYRFTMTLLNNIFPQKTTGYWSHDDDEAICTSNWPNHKTI